MGKRINNYLKIYHWYNILDEKIIDNTNNKNDEWYNHAILFKNVYFLKEKEEISLLYEVILEQFNFLNNTFALKNNKIFIKKITNDEWHDNIWYYKNYFFIYHKILESITFNKNDVLQKELAIKLLKKIRNKINNLEIEKIISKIKNNEKLRDIIIRYIETNNNYIFSKEFFLDYVYENCKNSNIHFTERAAIAQLERVTNIYNHGIGIWIIINFKINDDSKEYLNNIIKASFEDYQIIDANKPLSIIKDLNFDENFKHMNKTSFHSFIKKNNILSNKYQLRRNPIITTTNKEKNIAYFQNNLLKIMIKKFNGNRKEIYNYLENHEKISAEYISNIFIHNYEFILTNNKIWERNDKNK